MKIFKLAPLTRKNIEKTVHVPFDEIVLSGEKIVNKDVKFSKKRDLRKVGRGNPLLSRRKIRTMEDVLKKLERIE